MHASALTTACPLKLEKLALNIDVFSAAMQPSTSLYKVMALRLMEGKLVPFVYRSGLGVIFSEHVGPGMETKHTWGDSKPPSKRYQSHGLAYTMQASGSSYIYLPQAKFMHAGTTQ